MSNQFSQNINSNNKVNLDKSLFSSKLFFVFDNLEETKTNEIEDVDPRSNEIDEIKCNYYLSKELLKEIDSQKPNSEKLNKCISPLNKNINLSNLFMISAAPRINQINQMNKINQIKNYNMMINFYNNRNINNNIIVNPVTIMNNNNYDFVQKSFNVKDNNNNRKNHKNFEERKGDWVCPRCHNLNFSFRIMCNRCKMSKVNF